MEWVVTTGRTVSEARETALDQLGVDEQEAEIQVLEEPQTGLFGRLKVEARVRARVQPTTPRAKVDRRERRRRNGDRRSGKSGQSASNDAKATKKPGPAARETSKSRAGGSPARDGAGQSSDQSAAQNDEANAQQAASAGGAGQGNRSGRKRRRRSGGQQQGASKVANSTSNEIQEQDVPAPVDMDAQRQAVDEFLTGLLVAWGRPEVNVSTSTEDGTIVAEVEGDELGLMVGPKGQTLQAVHELTRSVVQRQFVGESHARLSLDVAGYRKRRAEALAQFTKGLADDVLSTGQAKALDPMSASDRKVVHDVVNEIDGVRTFSEGDEPNRRVVIDKG